MSSEWPKDFFRLNLGVKRDFESGNQPIQDQEWFTDLMARLNRCLPPHTQFKDEKADELAWYCASLENTCLIHFRVTLKGALLRFEHSLTLRRELWELAVRLFSGRMERENNTLRERYKPVYEAMERVLRAHPAFEQESG